MLNFTIEKGLIIGESPYMILSTNAPSEDFISDERSQGGTLFITSITEGGNVENPVDVIPDFIAIGAENEKVSDNQIEQEKTKFTKTDFERDLKKVSRKIKK
jgi:hypothetical protein